ncbi:MAG: AAA family ATPase [Ruminococcaceae bacterium]|nr:AAA family ATPase [Oscillospiraceae bacterium]
MIESNSSAIVTVEQLVYYLSSAYASIIENELPFNSLPSVMLWGPPGVGKSQGVRQIATNVQEKAGKRVNVTDVRLLLFNPVDLRGIPTANADKTLAIWLKPQIFQMDDSSDVVNILLLDEISAAPPSVQAAAYQITLDRVIGEHKLPDNCFVIAAGNRTTDKSVAYMMPKALANRMCHLEVIGDHDSWHKWAMKSGIHEGVIGYLNYKPDKLMQFDNKDSNAFATPRTWEMVSKLLTCVSDELSEIYPMVVGCIGEEVANDFREWYDIFQNVPPVDKIFAGTHKGVPQIPRIIYALSSQIVAYSRTHYSSKEIDNAIQYVSKFSVEFRNKVFMDLLRIKAVRPALKKNELFCNWFELTNDSWEYYE